MPGAVTFLVFSLLLGFVTHALWSAGGAIASRLDLMKTNFEGRRIPDLGWALWCAALIGYCTLARVSGDGTWQAFALITLVSGLVGIIDDRFGSHRFGGFRGHFGELARGHLTTGAAKALILPPAAMLTAMFCLHQSAAPAFLTAVLVALGANTINMLDIRPGSGVAAWLLSSAALVLCSFCLSVGALPLLLMVCPVMVYLPVDAGLRGMLGDTGSNLLGALLGLQIAVSTGPVVALPAAVALIYLEVYGEEHRVTPNIADHPAIQWLVRLARRLDWE
jgi:UDP-N-acetylmuramyl pentapeptide phosphotransferase/UDP-N-acetylglucosamine-1-phosphate transferase